VFCGAVGTSLCGNAWTDRIALHHERLTEQANINNPAFMQSMQTTQAMFHVNEAQARGMFDFSVNTQAAMMGLDDIFFASAVIFILIIPLIWITKRAKGGGGSAAAGAH
jgi:MFS transporter, DHA2 family, multidrug resistance protein